MLFGGIAKKKIYNDLRIFDIHKEKWTFNNNISENGPHFRFGHTANTFEDEMIVFGGSDGIKILNEFWSLSYKNF